MYYGLDNGGVDPIGQYRLRLDDRKRTAAGLERRHIRIGNLRLAIVIAGLGMAWMVFSLRTLPPGMLAAPVAAFGVAAAVHAQVIRRWDLSKRAVRYYQKALARLRGEWAGAGEPGDAFRDANHPYCEDLDLFGKGSLFELLSTARTRSGEETLASWLLQGAPLATVLERQAAIEELRARLDLREDLAVLGEDVRSGVRPGELIRWAEAPPRLAFSRLWKPAAALTSLMLVSWAVWAATGSTSLFLLALAAVAAFGGRLRANVLRVIGEADQAVHDLDLLAHVLDRLGRETFSTPLLSHLRSQIDPPVPASIRRLDRILEWLDSRDNVVLRLVGPPLLYGTHLSFAVEQWRSVHGRSVRQWLDAVGQIEALSSLAGYAFEHPADPFPELVPEGPCLEAESLAHPLLDPATAVGNDVRLSAAEPLLIVSGSNMSGKSTLLRTIGVNTVLALAGAPVRARSLRLTPLAVGATIRVNDSLQAGESRFYAEVKRLGRVVEMTRSGGSVLFLLDELLNGTNSHDRQVGAEAVVRELVASGALGLITTHDLALASIAGGAHGRNVHFQDHLENGKMTFDYRIQPGVVTKSNALELMRMVGLKVNAP